MVLRFMLIYLPVYAIKYMTVFTEKRVRAWGD